MTTTWDLKISSDITVSLNRLYIEYNKINRVMNNQYYEYYKLFILRKKKKKIC